MKTNTEYMCFSKFIYLYLFYSFQSKFGFYIAICILISFNLKTYQVFPKNINFIKKFTLLYFLKNFFEYKKEPFVEYIFHFLKKKSFIPKKNQCYGLNFLNSLLLVKTSDICKNFYRKLYLNEISENFKIKNVTKFLKKNKISVYLYRKTRKNSKKKDVYDSKLNTDFAYIFQNYEHFLNSLLAKENIKRIFFFPYRFTI
ncbi:hypothetical protein CPARA_1gp154 (nucleomorph) [Cryptomonas paramecium]|uniref:Uncharacterized protein n=1 Tax=Cryptomonas paramaecium TaxID=2898 RepID=F2HHL6_9CRYP|nr:hypothetical protein CPARA_1gp154 [Cryptomonas paramecium]AEA38812.1 hypothetical protein CPARA_1gp154 [Cryptomonas paramecium]